MIWILGFLMAGFVAGCCDPDKNAGAGGPGDPETPPTVISETPPIGASPVCPNTAIISATFSKAMNPATINMTTFTVTSGGVSVAGEVSYVAATDIATFTPTAALAPSTTYTATITTGATDTFGNTLAANFPWMFTTSASCLPTVISETPPIGASPVCPNTAIISATFSKAMNPATINTTTFTLTTGGVGVAGQVSYVAATDIATFTPTAALAPSTTYTAMITTGATDTLGNALGANFPWMFTTSASCAPPIPPTVTSETPPVDASPVCPNTAIISATFSKAMNPATINTTTFTVTTGGVGVAGQVSYVAATDIATFTPTAALAPSTTYTTTITTGATDTLGNTLATTFMWMFTTSASCAPPIPPTVTSETPPIGASPVCPNTAIISATFSKAMNPATINTTTFTVTTGGVGVAGEVSYVAATDIATFTPTAALAPSTTYTATITTGAADTLGNTLATTFMWMFTTSASCAPPIPPTVTSETPPIGVSPVCPNTAIISATFSKAMNPATINTTTFTVTSGGVSVAGEVSYVAATDIATFTPTAALAPSTTYTAMITTGATDTLGNALATTFMWMFTTSASCAPTVTSETPPIDASPVCPNTAIISATFSKAMNPATINTTTFTLTTGGVGVAGQVSYVAATDIATFTPTAALAPSTTYTATITTGAMDTLGNTLATTFMWMFTTSASCTPPVGIVTLGAACPFGILGATPAVTSVGPTVVTGNVGIWPAASITGFPPGTFTGTEYIDDATAMMAQGDLTTAYNEVAGAGGGTVLTADIGGQTLPAGVYKTTSAQPSLGITGILTLNGGGDPNSTWIFQIMSSLTTAADNSQVILENGASAHNVFWQVGSSATLGTNTTFQGTIMALASVTLTTGATLDGRALAFNRSRHVRQQSGECARMSMKHSSSGCVNPEARRAVTAGFGTLILALQLALDSLRRSREIAGESAIA